MNKGIKKSVLIKGVAVMVFERPMTTNKGVDALQYLNDYGFQVALVDKNTGEDLGERD